MRILWLSHFVPYPPKGGAFQRNFHLLTRLARAADVHFVGFRHKASTHPASELADAHAVLEAHCRSVDIVDISERTRPAGLAWRALRTAASGEPLTTSLFASVEMEHRLRTLVSRFTFDAAHFETVSVAPYLPCVGDIPCVLSHQGAESYMLRRRVAREPNLAKKAFFLLEARRLAASEATYCPKFALNVVVSDLDEQLIRRTAPGAKFATIDNGVDSDYFRPHFPRKGRRLIFAGRLDQYSNRDAIRYFVRDVWPRVRRRFADAELDVVGHHPPPELFATNDLPGVTVHGFVSDLRPLFDRATAYVCPIRDGGGTRIKVLDALASALPTVATTVACEGLHVVPDRDVLIADSIEDFERQIGRVFESAELRESLGRSARHLAEHRYSWDSLGAKLIRAYREVMDLRSRTSQRTGVAPSVRTSSL